MRRATCCVANGTAGSRISTISYGKDRPAALGSSEDAWAQNRRAVTVSADPGTLKPDRRAGALFAARWNLTAPGASAPWRMRAGGLSPCPHDRHLPAAHRPAPLCPAR